VDSAAKEEIVAVTVVVDSVAAKEESAAAEIMADSVISLAKNANRKADINFKNIA
jgi:hypothetical protein